MGGDFQVRSDDVEDGVRGVCYLRRAVAGELG